MQRSKEGDRLVAEATGLRDLAARYRRRHHYMSRNRDGDYSAEDLILVLFAADIADNLAEYTTSQIGIKKVVKKSKSWTHEFSRLQWYESAQRDDILMGQIQDFENMRSAF